MKLGKIFHLLFICKENKLPGISPHEMLKTFSYLWNMIYYSVESEASPKYKNPHTEVHRKLNGKGKTAVSVIQKKQIWEI